MSRDKIWSGWTRVKCLCLVCPWLGFYTCMSVTMSCPICMQVNEKEYMCETWVVLKECLNMCLFSDVLFLLLCLSFSVVVVVVVRKMHCSISVFWSISVTHSKNWNQLRLKISTRLISFSFLFFFFVVEGCKMKNETEWM